MRTHPFATRLMLSARLVLRTVAQAVITATVFYVCLFVAARSFGQPVPGPVELIKDVAVIWELARFLG